MEANQPTTTDFESYFQELDAGFNPDWVTPHRAPIGRQSLTVWDPTWIEATTPDYAVRYKFPETITPSLVQSRVFADGLTTTSLSSTYGPTLNNTSSSLTVTQGDRDRFYFPVENDGHVQNDGRSNLYQHPYLQPGGFGGQAIVLGGSEPQHTRTPQMMVGVPQWQVTGFYAQQAVQSRVTGFNEQQHVQLQPQATEILDKQQYQQPIQSQPTQYAFQDLPQQLMQHQPAANSQLNSLPSRLPCDYPGCKSKGFLRQRDLTKHQRKHTRDVIYDCPAVGCVMTGDRANCLRDKFVSHLRKGHRRPTAWRCPVGNCEMQVQSMDLLTEHLRGHGEVANVDEKRLVDAVCAAGRA